MPDSLTGLVRSFGYALDGLAFAVRTQRNMRIHLFLAFTALACALFIHLSPALMLPLVLVVILVVAAELFNTALEAAVDLHGPARRPLAAAVKDVAAAGVLVTAAGALTTGAFLFGPRLALLWPLVAAVGRGLPVVAAALALALGLRAALRSGSRAPAWGVAAAFALATWLWPAAGPGTALFVLLAGLVLACCGPGGFRTGGRSFWGGLVIGVLAGLLGIHFLFF